MSSSEQTWGILVAAGRGDRFGGSKHDITLDGEPMWMHARRSLLDGSVAQIVVVGDVPGGIEGGRRRQDSVANGLAQIPVSARYVLVHDAARPLASSDLVRRVIQRLHQGDVAGVVPVIPLPDTVKEIDDDEVVRTVDRSQLAASQTPQGFVTEVLRRAHSSSETDVTDDAMAVEALGERVVTVPGEPGNLKITYPEDLQLAAVLRTAAHG
jgi:2-C-methyl-D-erythritol 4-phosphate cytidylyltransferase